VLGAFLFRGDDVDKKIGVLSGGERARVALARMLMRPGNCMLMDEPTNHLDLASSEALAESLASYDGTLLFVSHNRSFVKRLATQIWNLEDGQLEVYPGSLEEYLYALRVRQEGGPNAGSQGAGPSEGAQDAGS
jgi:ATP-binding cassette subfamily F protein 3